MAEEYDGEIISFLTDALKIYLNMEQFLQNNFSMLADTPKLPKNMPIPLE